VRAVVLVLSSTFAIRGLQVLPRSLMNRDLEYRRLAAVDVVEAAALAGTTLGLALAGMGYWALVLGNVAGALASALVCVALRPHALAWPNDFARIRTAVTYGMHVVSGRLAWYAYSNADFAIVGRVLGKAALGAYSFGWTLAMIPVERVTALLARVTYATFARVQDDHAALRRYVRGFTEAIALLTFPAAAGTALVADLLVRVVLGPQWEAAIVPLRILTLSTLLRSVLPLLPQVLLAIGQAKRSRDQNLVLAIVLPGLFLLASRWGIVAVAAVWVVGYPITAIATMLRSTCRAIGLPLRDYWASLWPATSATVLMAAAVLGARWLVPWELLPPRMRLPGALLGCVAVGAAAYAGALLVLHRPRLQAMLRLVRGGGRA
jgi:O-antigen/teichoic acid export membrane protein